LLRDENVQLRAKLEKPGGYTGLQRMNWLEDPHIHKKISSKDLKFIS
jgi:hypothetical protein